MITSEQYFGDHIPEGHVASNAIGLLVAVNGFLADFKDAHPEWIERMSSGYRSPEHNAKVGGAKASNHTKGLAIDIADYDRTLARYCFAHTRALELLSLYCEDFRATKNWVHFQVVAPKSGSRFFVPSQEWAERLAGKPLTLESIR